MALSESAVSELRAAIGTEDTQIGLELSPDFVTHLSGRSTVDQPASNAHVAQRPVVAHLIHRPSVSRQDLAPAANLAACTTHWEVGGRLGDPV